MPLIRRTHLIVRSPVAAAGAAWSGGHDRAAPLEQARLIAARIPRARLRVLPGRSHLPYIGDVDAIVATARDFLGLPPRHRPTAPP